MRGVACSDEGRRGRRVLHVAKKRGKEGCQHFRPDARSCASHTVARIRRMSLHQHTSTPRTQSRIVHAITTAQTLTIVLYPLHTFAHCALLSLTLSVSVFRFAGHCDADDLVVYIAELAAPCPSCIERGPVVLSIWRIVHRSAEPYALPITAFSSRSTCCLFRPAGFPLAPAAWSLRFIFRSNYCVALPRHERLRSAEPPNIHPV